ncbi:cobalamin biosynthesis protein [Methanolapillus ohkumae]|uniref:Probable cobalamin biosynthesis protein CobD n=1 Tax=Methanolapillus ohkumae TaxID=3028298 RepID=A0AA96VFF3_9EURY|nr:Cobalamin biosynthesis protein CobD [Methanosarcinaceae archaeon Am2]
MVYYRKYEWTGEFVIFSDSISAAFSEISALFSGMFSYSFEELICILLLAVLIDLVLGEPPEKIHPVVWIGKVIQFFKSRIPKNHQKLYGILLGLSTMIFSGTVAFVVVWFSHLDFMPFFVSVIIQAWFLKATFAIKCMVSPAKEMKEKLKLEDLDVVRDELKTYVGRDTSHLTKSQIMSAILESVSENFVDAILSPLLFFTFFGPFGLVAAYVFKATSTLDSMVGYKTEKYIHVGWFSARFDDVLNWIPARLSPLFIAAGSVLSNFAVGQDMEKMYAKDGFSLAVSDHKVTPSPNSGWPMSAASGSLHVRFEKPNMYVIGKQYREPVIRDIDRASVLILVTSLFSGVVCCVIIYMIYLLYGLLL